MTGLEPLELLTCFLARPDTVRIMAADVRVGIECGQGVEIARLQMPQHESRGFEHHHQADGASRNSITMLQRAYTGCGPSDSVSNPCLR